MKYSVTSVCLPSLDLAGQCRLLRELGFDALELRVRRVSDDLRAKAEPSFWGYHVNDITPENFADRAAEVNRILADYGLQLAGLATNMTCTDLEQFRHVLDGAVLTHAPFIRLGAARGFNGRDHEDYREIYGETLAGFARCVELAKGTGIRLIVEMHGNTIHPSASLALRIAGAFSPAQTGVIYDPQNMVRDGYETPAIAIPMLGDYLAHCHFGAHRPIPGDLAPDGTRQWKWEACDMAEGLFHFPTAMALLRKLDYQGFISIEDFRANLDPATKFGNAIRYLKSIEAQ